MKIKCFFSIHEIHKNSQKIYSNNYNSAERTRIIISHADLFDYDNNINIGTIFEKTIKIMDNTHSTFVEFYIYLKDYGKISILDPFFLHEIHPFHTDFSFEVIQRINYKDSLNYNSFYGKELKISYNNIISEYKGIFEITEL